MHNGNIKKNTFFNAIKTAFSIIFPIVTFPYISRKLGPENTGKINFGNSIVGYTSLLATLSVNTYAIRECARVKENRNELGKTSGQILSINLFTTAIAYIILAMLLMWHGAFENYRFLISIQSTNILFTVLGADWLNTAMEDFKYITLRTVGFQILSLLLMFALVKKPSDYLKYVLISIIASSGGNILNIFYRRRYCKTRLTFHTNVKKHLPPIINLFAMAIAIQVFTMSDITIIGLVLGDYEVGLYSAAVKIFNLANQMMLSITWVVIPQLSVAYGTENMSEVKKMQKYVIQFTSVIGIPCAIGMFLLSTEILSVAGGEVYAEASYVLKFLAIALLGSLIGNFVMNINLLAAGKDRVCLIACLTAAAFNIITNIIFVPKFGISAAAVTTIISHIVVVIACVPFLNLQMRIKQILLLLVQPIAASIVLAFIVQILRGFVNNILIRLVVSVICGAVTYFIVLLLMKNDFIINIFNSIIAKKHKLRRGK